MQTQANFCLVLLSQRSGLFSFEFEYAKINRQSVNNLTSAEEEPTAASEVEAASEENTPPTEDTTAQPKTKCL